MVVLMANNARRPLHTLEEIPDGVRIGDINPTFSAITHEVKISKPGKVCGSCRKPFNLVRKPRAEIRLYPVETKIPFAWFHEICGSCRAMYQKGRESRQAILAAVEAYHYRDEAKQ